MDDFGKLYIVNYRIHDEDKSSAYWSLDAAMIDFYNTWINEKQGLTGEMARDAWNELMNTWAIPEVGEIVTAEWADHTGGLKI